jgi:hypothetical protein
MNEGDAALFSAIRGHAERNGCNSGLIARVCQDYGKPPEGGSVDYFLQFLGPDGALFGDAETLLKHRVNLNDIPPGADEAVRELFRDYREFLAAERITEPQLHDAAHVGARY